jgi:hypothetical protein
MSSVYSTLNFNFDTSKFGSALYLSPQAEAYLNAAPLVIPEWQKNDMANGNINMANYYKNPTANACINLSSNANTMLAFTPFTDTANLFLTASVGANNLIANLNNLVIEINAFKLHTDNVSGVYTMTSNTDTIPSLDHATSIGNQLLRVLSTTDGVANTVPLLGNMTSLFIANDIISYTTTVASNMVVLNNSVSGGISNISNSAMNLIISDVQTMNNYIALRRTSDCAFYVRSIQILDDYNKVSKFDNMGNTQTYLVNNLIGTDRLKNNLANQ